MSIATESAPRKFEGSYEVFSRKLYPRFNEPHVRFSHDSFRFNQASVKALDQAEKISVFINEAEKKLIVRPTEERFAPGTKWTYTAGTQLRPQTIASAPFMKKLYEAMGWFPEFDYRAIGATVQTHCGPMLLFELDDSEMIIRWNAPLHQ